MPAAVAAFGLQCARGEMPEISVGAAPPTVSLRAGYPEITLVPPHPEIGFNPTLPPPPPTVDAAPPPASLWDEFTPSAALFPQSGPDSSITAEDIQLTSPAPPAPAPLLFRPVTINPDPPPPASAADDRPPESDPAYAPDPGAPAGGDPGGNGALMQIVRRVAPAVLTITSWDEFGHPLAEGTGFFVSPRGHILTDPGIVHPQLGARIAYVTATTGTREHHRIEGVWVRDLEAGFALLQSAERQTPHLAIGATSPLAEEAPVTVLGLNEQRGLVLADAVAAPDLAISGRGWLRLSGEDSPGAPGSPIFDASGGVAGLISMSVPMDRWVSYGVPLAAVRAALANRSRDASTLTEIEALDGDGFLPVTQDNRFAAAVQELYEGSPKSAVRDLLKLTRRYPRSPELWAVLGVGWAELKRPDEARACHARAVALDPETGIYWRGLALSQAGQPVGEVADANRIEALEHALADRPADRVATRLLADRYLEAKRYREASDTLVDLIKIAPGDPDPYYLLGIARSKLGDIRAAEGAVQQCLRRDPRHGGAWFLLGLIHDKRGAADEALEAYTKATRYRPDHPHAWMNLAAAFKAAGDSAAARDAMQEHFRVSARRNGAL